MDLDELSGKVFMIGLPSPEIDDPAKRVLEVVRPGSVILFGRNIKDREQVVGFIRAIEDLRKDLLFHPVPWRWHLQRIRTMRTGQLALTGTWHRWYDHNHYNHYNHYNHLVENTGAVKTISELSDTANLMRIRSDWKNQQKGIT